MPAKETETETEVDVHLPTETGPVYRSACTECQRRKQKCNRKWPCVHCLKRKVGDMCDYSSEIDPTKAWTASPDIKRKRELESAEEEDEDDEDESAAAAAALEDMGYTTTHVLANLNIKKDKNKPKQYRLTTANSAQLQRALSVLPCRQHIDIMVRNFLDNVNFYYYLVYPGHFITQYAQWWNDRENELPLGIQWTCLLIMVCACSVQHADGTLTDKLEREIGSSVKELTETYHDAARELHAIIPVGNHHLFGVQYLLHSCYWFKAEARFVECWQILGATVREAQALNLHLEVVDDIPEFEREMRRRTWCIVDSWDWLVSSLLARPMLIDRTDCNVALPLLTVEPFPVSPMLHLKLQSHLVSIIFKRFGPPKVLTDHDDIQEYQSIIERFMLTFPPAYAFENPDEQHEKQYPWIALHRHYMHTCTLAIALGPFRPFMAKSLAADSPAIELQFRRDGINYSLQLLEAVQRFFAYVWNRDTTFHFVPFCIFDTSALLCSAILHDPDESVPRREEIVTALFVALDTLSRLRTATKTAKAPYDLLQRLLKRVMNTLSPAFVDGHRKRQKRNHPSPNPPAIEAGPSSAESPHSVVSRNSIATSQSVSHPESMTLSSSGRASISSHEPTTAPVSPLNSTTQSCQMAPEQYVQWTNEYQQYPPGQQPPGQQPIVPAEANGAHMVAPVQMNGVIPAPAMHNIMTWSLPQATQANAEMQQRMMNEGQNMAAGLFLEGELGDLANLWNWESLDLGFTSNPILQ